MRRFSIINVMVFVLVCAPGLVALNNVNHQRASMIPLVALASVCVAMVEAVILNGKGRYWCVGFALFCGCYLAFAFAPWLSTRVQPIRWTSYVLDELFSVISPLTAGGPKMEQINRTSLARPQQLADEAGASGWAARWRALSHLERQRAHHSACRGGRTRVQPASALLSPGGFGDDHGPGSAGSAPLLCRKAAGNGRPGCPGGNYA